MKRKKRSNLISINGKFYDAKTGLPSSKSVSTLSVSDDSSTSSKSQVDIKPNSKTNPNSTRPVRKPSAQTRSIDGFSIQPTNKKKVKSAIVASSSDSDISSGTESTKAVLNVGHDQSKTTASGSTHNVASHAKQKASRAVTLNRSSVKRPDFTSVSEKAHEDVSSHNQTEVVSTASKLADKSRFDRVKTIEKSQNISRFNTDNMRPDSREDEDVETELDETATLESITSDFDDEDIDSIETKDKTEALSPKESYIQNTLARSASEHHATHNEHESKSSKKSIFRRYATAGLVMLVLVGYVTYLNVPSISMKVASSRAGFNATMPAYQPSGYSMKGPIAYSPGQVVINFGSNTDERKFSLRQQPSTWDSSALLENYVAKQSTNYQTYQDQGLTIYIYDGASAAWVNGGKMYVIDGDNSQLDAEQILRLATNV